MTLFSALVINWRGCIAPASAIDLKSAGFSDADLILLAALTVEHGAEIHNVYRKIV